ncbi:hypothetical protein GE09DRAFT_1262908 [Coniochaeta sp. 2T2.1]|nr:hypothetical protein GE09DRAFT_1262908 [Coniochaeta sp. 2T2.1]
MHYQALLNFLALAATSVPLVSASPIEPTDVESPAEKFNVSTDPLRSEDTVVTITQCANLLGGQSANDTSVIWEDCPAVIARHESLEAEHDAMRKRGIICKKRNGCQPPCYVSNTQSMQLNGKGTWWTRWCHQGGLHTRNKGSAAWVSVGHSTSVTWSGSVGLAGPVGKYLDAQLGFSVTRSKSINQGVGCVNQDGKAHGVWLQEKMGWSDTRVTSTVKQTGGGCENPGTHTYVNNVHADFPDPNNAGYRDLLAGCGSPDDDKAPWCNLNAPSLNQN